MRIHADPDPQHWFNVRNLHSRNYSTCTGLFMFFLYILCTGISLLYEIRLSQLNTLLVDVPKFHPAPPPTPSAHFLRSKTGHDWDPILLSPKQGAGFIHVQCIDKHVFEGKICPIL
jgi:hypothetical protein